MADPAPLLDKSGQSDEATSNSGMHKNISLDSAFDQCLGDQFGLIQLLQVFLISLSWAFDAQQVFISIFTDAVPTWHCTVNSVTSCSPAAKLCEMKEGTWAWDLPAHASIVSEWNLQCSSPTILGLPASSHFIGCLVGGFALSTLADSSLGRKKTLVLSCLVMSLGGALTTLSTDIWVYSALRFISGFGRATVGTSALVLITELIGNRWRGHVAMVSYSFFTVGFLSLPAFAYMCRGHSWRIIYLLTSLPTVLYTLLAHYFVLESPRWLLLHGVKNEATRILRKLRNEDNQSIKTLTSVSQLAHMKEERFDIYSAVKILVSKRWSIHRLSAVMTLAFGIAVIYVGMPLGVGELGSNLYLSVTLNALFELPASVMAFLLLKRRNRKTTILFLTLLSGTSSVMCTALSCNEILRMALELASYFCACIAFDVMLIYVVELFPTCVRNTAMAMVKQAIFLGSAVTPILVAALHGNWILQYWAFGLEVAVCGLFVVRLPETRGMTMCDTMEEQEHKERTSCFQGSRGHHSSNIQV